MSTVTEKKRHDDCEPKARFCLNIERVKHPWPVSIIFTEQIAELGGWDISQGVLQIDSENNERQLEPGELVKLEPGLEFCKRVRWKRGANHG